MTSLFPADTRRLMETGAAAHFLATRLLYFAQYPDGRVGGSIRWDSAAYQFVALVIGAVCDLYAELGHDHAEVSGKPLHLLHNELSVLVPGKGDGTAPSGAGFKLLAELATKVSTRLHNDNPHWELQFDPKTVAERVAHLPALEGCPPVVAPSAEAAVVPPKR